MRTTLFILLSFCALIHGAKQNTERVQYGLNEDLRDFIRLIPTYDMIHLYQSLSNQKYIVQPLDYFHSPDFIAAVKAFVEFPELKPVVDYMDNQGLPLTKLLQEIANRLGYEFWRNDKNATDVDLKMNYFLEEASKLQNTRQIEAELVQKYLHSEAFSGLINTLQAVDMNGLKTSAAKHPKIVKVAIQLTILKVKFEDLSNFLKLLFVGHYFD